MHVFLFFLILQRLHIFPLSSIIYTMSDETEIVKISVRNLVEFLLRSGDLTAGGPGVRNLEAMQEGSRIHRKIQKSMGVGYEAEVSLMMQFSVRSQETREDFTLQVEGRADGIWRPLAGTSLPKATDVHVLPGESGQGSTEELTETAGVPEDAEPDVLIDEIKGVYQDISRFEKPDPVHLAQAMCYAYMVITAEVLPRIAVQITYCQIDTEQIRRFRSVYTAEEITTWFLELIEQYKPWAVYEYDWRRKRTASIEGLRFPFPFRTGQDDLVAYTYRQIRDKGRLFIEAPTGVGKTITTIFPSVKAMGEGLCDRIFYLTAKTITRTVAEECFTLLKTPVAVSSGSPDQPDTYPSEPVDVPGLAFKSITLTAKEKLCILDKPNCDPSLCERAHGHFNRVNEALYELLIHEDSISRDIILDYADRYTVCPFELSLDVSLFADAVIGDYNYVFDPNVYLRRFFTPGKQGNMVLLVDEAHNLVERGREMYSAALVKEDFLAVARLTRAMQKKEHRADALYTLRQFTLAAEAVNRELLTWKRQCDSFLLIDDLGTLAFKLLRVVSNYEIMAAENPVLPDRETFVEFYFSVRNFLLVWENYDDHYRTYANYDEEGHFRIILQCMDPSKRLREVCERARAGIFFSATLLPIRYYKEQLGGEKDDPAVYAQSSFSEEQRRILIASDVTSLYRSRGPAMYQRIASYIERFVTAQEGNYLIFFPSYRFLEEVSILLSLPEDRNLLVQGRHMRETERERFLEEFEGENVVGLCVMGGIFAEGIDLTGDRLIGAAIVGTGLPMVCDERELFRSYYDQKKGNGFDYAYLYPGIGKVFQAGGRVIRTATDRGVVLLLDDRFLRQEYRSNFPREWQGFRTVTLDTLEEELTSFWKTPD